MKKGLLFSLLLCCSGTSLALTQIIGKVTYVEPSFAPTAIYFQMDSGAGVCAANTNLKWQKSDIENNKAIYAALLAASTAGKTIRFYFNDGDTTCSGQALHVLAN